MKYILAFFIGFALGAGTLSLLFVFPIGLSLAATIGLFIGLAIVTGLLADFLVWLWPKIFPTKVKTEEIKENFTENREKLLDKVEETVEIATQQEIATKLSEREAVVQWLRENITTATKEEITQRLTLLYQLRQYYSVSTEEYKEELQKYINNYDKSDLPYPFKSTKNPSDEDFTEHFNSHEQSYEKATLLLLEGLLISDILFAHIETKITQEKSKPAGEKNLITPKEFVSILVGQGPESVYAGLFRGICGYPVKSLFTRTHGEPLQNQSICKQVFATPPAEGSASNSSASQTWRWGFMHNHFTEYGLYGSYSTPFWRMNRKQKVIQPLDKGGEENHQQYYGRFFRFSKESMSRQHTSNYSTMQLVPMTNPLAAAFLTTFGGDERFYKLTSMLPTENFPPKEDDNVFAWHFGNGCS